MLYLQNLADFKTRSGLGFVHLNVWRLLPKMNMVCICARNTTAATVLVISETWLNNSVLDNAIKIEGYNVEEVG